MKETMMFLFKVHQNFLKQIHNADQREINRKIIPIGARAVKAILKNIVDPPNYLKL